MTGQDLVKLRHPEWVEHRVRWQWLADSLEGGDRYRWARYGADRRGFPIRNLVRHKREYPSPGEAVDRGSILFALNGENGAYAATPEATATDDDYSLRLIRTPVPDFVSECVRKHLGRIYRHGVRRSGPAGYTAWTEDVDGAGTPLDAWMRQTIAPQLVAIGCLDVLMDHPTPPPGSTVRSRADRDALRLDAVVAKAIPPTDVVWWRLDARRRYEEAIVRETAEGDGGKLEDRYRHWTKAGWTLHADDGRVLGQDTHPYGVVPIVRLFVARKHRCENSGWTPLEAVAERQREYYNRDSELVLSDVLQAHPLLQGPPPEEDGTISLGPQWLLAKKESRNGAGVTYEGYEYVDPPKGGADSIRANLDRIRSDVEASQGMAKPAGAEGSTAGVVAQSGLSKSFDHATYNDLLDELADALQAAEVEMGRLASIVATDGGDPGESVEVAYSRKYDLRSGDELAASLATFQDTLSASGRCPELETRVLMAVVRDELLPGLDEAEYAPLEAEVKAAVATADEERRQGLMNEMRAATGADPADDPMMDEDDDPTVDESDA
jgi:hypothetical protein